MRVAVEAAEDVSVGDDVLAAVNREVTERGTTPGLFGARDVRLRLRRAKGALMCIVAVGFPAGTLVTSTATRSTPMEAIVEALDGLPERMQRVQPAPALASVGDAPSHAAVRDTLKRLLDRA